MIEADRLYALNVQSTIMICALNFESLIEKFRRTKARKQMFESVRMITFIFNFNCYHFLGSDVMYMRLRLLEI